MGFFFLANVLFLIQEVFLPIFPSFKNKKTKKHQGTFEEGLLD